MLVICNLQSTICYSIEPLVYQRRFAKASRSQQQCESVRKTAIEPGIQARTLDEPGWKVGRMQLGFQQRNHTQMPMVCGYRMLLMCENCLGCPHFLHCKACADLLQPRKREISGSTQIALFRASMDGA